MKTLSVIIPCFNEVKTVEQVIEKILALSIPDFQKEIILVDDGSTDGTRDILKKYEKNCLVFYHANNLGKGSAVKTGLEKAAGDYILIQDADLEYDVQDILKLTEKINGEKIAVYGSRNLLKRKKEGMLLPRLGVWFLTKEFNLLFGTRLTDIWTCYKLFPQEAGKFFTAGRFESELSFSASLVKNGYKIIEVPISHNPRSFEQGKKITYRDGLKGIWTVFKSRF